MIAAGDQRSQETRAAVIVEGISSRDGYGVVLGVRDKIAADPQWAVQQVKEALGYVPTDPEAYLAALAQSDPYNTGYAAGW